MLIYVFHDSEQKVESETRIKPRRRIKGGGGGGGGGLRPLILEILIMRYGLKGKARSRPDFFRLVLGPCAQFYPCEASEQKWGRTPKS